jgi:hypothetical protein
MESRPIIDLGALADAVQAGQLGALCGGERIGVGELTMESMRRCRCGKYADEVSALAHAVAVGKVEVLRASAVEIAAVVRWVGSDRLSGAELEAVALVLAGKGRLCTQDAVVIRVMRELGLEERLITPKVFYERGVCCSEPG